MPLKQNEKDSAREEPPDNLITKTKGQGHLPEAYCLEADVVLTGRRTDAYIIEWVCTLQRQNFFLGL